MCSECGRGGKQRRGLCGACYARWLRTQPSTLKDQGTPAERFWARVQRGDGCWLWTGYRTPKGYGQTSISHRRHAYAHRFAYELMVAPIPDDMTIDHLCGVRFCVNPAHMEVVTRGENTRRGQAPRPCLACDRSITPANMRRHLVGSHQLGEQS